MRVSAFQRTALAGTLTSSTATAGTASGQLDADILRLREEVQRFESTLAADAAFLHPAERDAQVAQEPAVDPHRAGVQLRGDAVGALQVARPDRGGEPVLRRVGGAHRFLVALERRDGDD